MTKQTIKNYGFIAPKIILPDHYVLGGGQVPQIPENEARDWRPFLPEYEPQFNPLFDSAGCTVWGTQNCVETLLKQKTGNDFNYSERFTYILAKIRPPGADPHHTAEIIRKTGLIEDSLLPLLPEMSYDQFIQPDPPTDVHKRIGKEWIDDYNFKHEWVTPTIDNLIHALQFSPLGISVTAWVEKDGLYVDEGQRNTHWCELTFVEKVKGKYYRHIFDSYDHSTKILSPNHRVQFAKRYFVNTKKNALQYTKAWWRNILNIFTLKYVFND